jgi:pimeloyl-ACP methyl ester carboxylesterase
MTRFVLSRLLAVSLEAGVESRVAPVGGLHLHYADWGGSGEPLIFIPGGCDTAFVFGDVATRLAKRFKVVGLTARGCGASDRPESGYDMAHQVADIAGFMDYLKVDRATLIGHSSGGGKITQFAHRYPERVRRLIYLDTVFQYVAPGLEETIDREIGKAVLAADSADTRKRKARMWELGAWSAALLRNVEETFALDEPANWRAEIHRDMESALYFDTRIAHAALMIFAMDTDRIVPGSSARRCGANWRP